MRAHNIIRYWISPLYHKILDSFCCLMTCLAAHARGQSHCAISCTIRTKNGIYRKHPSSRSWCLHLITSVTAPEGIHFQTLVVQLTLESSSVFSAECAPQLHLASTNPLLFHLLWHRVIQSPVGASLWNGSMCLTVVADLVFTLDLHCSQLEVSLVKR